VVFSSDNLKRFSKTIIIDHGDGFSTVYARNAQILVKPGESVQRGTLIAKVGSNSMRDKNTYLHFEIRKSHIPKNPYFYLP
jgi:murein DD-endopeptidase MepM/ murein hydrolase activator NlpD